ncbi:hypothetical protein [Salinibacterium sp. M195]|uniref:hypothetical protein n=1 Tax=Salinibacterium sp. M195 TaxID=2583374 RepID=UPI001C62C18D|nr:hypothetical protein [Salinibacterium sp. M195]QYH35305.1 hypothetical protein FFT87_04695 [Salinibacterium sp. M195]
MRVLLKLVLDCDPDDAWRAIRSPHVFQEVSAPLTRFSSLAVGGFPELWPAGEHPVGMSAFGLCPVGQQVIDVSFPDAPAGVRIMRDSGRGLSGPLALVAQWEHSMAISAAPGGKTLYRDQLIFSAGVLTPLMWPLYWAFWQWRGVALRRLAPTWSWGTTRRTNLSL